MFKSNPVLRLLLACLLAVAYFAVFANSAQADYDQLQGCDPECPPPEETYEPPSDGGDDGESWPGYSDGRLNPDMAEFYTIYCHDNNIYVLGGSPQPQLVDTIPINDVIALRAIDLTFSSIGLRIKRMDDLITIRGGHGNAPDHNGEKSFSLSACIDANGGAPPPPPPPPPLPTFTAIEQADNLVFLCANERDFVDFMICIQTFSPDVPPFEFFFYRLGVIWAYCANGLLPFGLLGSAPVVWRWRRKRNAARRSGAD